MFFDVIAKFMTYFLTILTSVSLLFIQWISSIGILDHIVKDEGVVFSEILLLFDLFPDAK